MTTAAPPPTDSTETAASMADGVTADGTALDGTGAQATDLQAIPTPDAMPSPAPTEPAQVVEATNDLVEGIGEHNETAGAFLETLRGWAIETDSFRFSLLDALLIVGVILLVVSVAWLATRLTRAALKRATRLDGSQRVLTEKLSTLVIWGAAFFIGIDLLGIDLTALAFFGGAFGLAIGFGLQKTFGNLISGILLLLDKSIKPGDVITVTDGSGNESFGQIRKIGIRAISVITRDQTEYLIPNENLMINQVVNWSYSSRDVRVRAPIGVSYNSDLQLVKKLLYQAVDDTDRILANPRPRVNLMGFGDSSVDFEVRFWIRDPEEGLSNIRSDVYDRMWELFKEHGVEIPFPQRDLNLRSSKQMDRLIEVMSKQRAENG